MLDFSHKFLQMLHIPREGTKQRQLKCCHRRILWKTQRTSWKLLTHSQIYYKQSTPLVTVKGRYMEKSRNRAPMLSFWLLSPPLAFARCYFLQSDRLVLSFYPGLVAQRLTESLTELSLQPLRLMKGQKILGATCQAKSPGSTKDTSVSLRNSKTL